MKRNIFIFSVLWTLIIASSAWPAMQYDAIGLGVMPGGTASTATGLNNNGLVVGYNSTSDGYQRAFVWDIKTQTMTILDIPLENHSSIAFEINDAGRIAGSVDWHAATWEQDGTINMLTSDDAELTEAMSINSSGLLVGYGQTFYYSTGSWFIWDPIMQEPTFYDGLDGEAALPLSINDSSQVVGTSMPAPEAFIWDPMAGLSRLSNDSLASIAYDINNQGQVVGCRDTIDGQEPFLWTTVGGMVSLGKVGNNSTFCYVSGINDSGQIVAFNNNGYIREIDGPWMMLEGMLSLTSLDWIFIKPYAINEKGWIAGSAHNMSTERNEAVILVPAEICNDLIDNNDDGIIDCADPSCSTDSFCCPDRDYDSFSPVGGICGALDCNDLDSSLNPEAIEICDDQLDNDCDGLIDCDDESCSGTEFCMNLCYSSQDCTIGEFCSKRFGSCLGPGQCQPKPPPDAICLHMIQCGCDGVTYYNSCQPAWAGVSVAYQGDCTGPVYCFDWDGDHYSHQGGYCGQYDCLDTDPAVHTSALEICDQIDNDCDGDIDEHFDKDRDLYTTCGGDCDDTNATINPGAVDICDGIDNNCDGFTDEDFDLDGDGYAPCAGDCDDSDPSINPGAPDVIKDGIDQDCNGYDLTIDIISVNYNPKKDELGVEATNSLGPDDPLDLAGYGLMTWNPKNLKWSITVDPAGGDPGTVAVCGIEGCQTAWTNGPPCVPVPEICDDQVDNDCDGLMDNEDPDCDEGCTGTEKKMCADNLDNDCDGLLDCEDSDCSNNQACR